MRPVSARAGVSPQVERHFGDFIEDNSARSPLEVLMLAYRAGEGAALVAEEFRSTRFAGAPQLTATIGPSTARCAHAGIARRSPLPVPDSPTSMMVACDGATRRSCGDVLHFWRLADQLGDDFGRPGGVARGRVVVRGNVAIDGGAPRSGCGAGKWMMQRCLLGIRSSGASSRTTSVAVHRGEPHPPNVRTDSELL
jgi:hypothetical protein